MTVPTNWNFPLHAERILSLSPKEQERYWREFIFSIQRMYEQLAQGINGDQRSYVSQAPATWTPTLNATTTPDDFTYDHQIGWVWRQGIYTELWFDVQWTSAGSAAGNLYLELPYVVATSDQKPFVGVVQASNVNYVTGYDLVINAIPDTNRGEFWYTTSGGATGNQTVESAGQLIGHIRYIGKADE